MKMLVTRHRRITVAFTLMSVLLTACGEDRASSTATVGHREMPPTTGPASGTLVVAGGNVKDAAIIERFLELAGGPGDTSEPFAVISSRSWDDKGGDQSSE